MNKKIDPEAQKNLKSLIGKPILDIPCPLCASEDTYQYDTDEEDFSYNGTGHYYVDYCCKNCGENFRIYIDFKYTITDIRY